MPSNDDFTELVAEDVRACRADSVWRPDIGPLRESPHKWLATLGDLLDESTHLLLASELGPVNRRRLERFAYLCRVRIMEVQRIIYWQFRGMETSTSHMLCDMVENHRRAKGGSGDDADETLWQALDGISAL